MNTNINSTKVEVETSTENTVDPSSPSSTSTENIPNDLINQPQTQPEITGITNTETIHIKSNSQKIEENVQKPSSSSKPRQFIVLVFDGDSSNNWPNFFNEKSGRNFISKTPSYLSELLGSSTNTKHPIRVVQASFFESSATSYPESDCYVSVAALSDTGGKKLAPKRIIIKPDLVVVRNAIRPPFKMADRRSVLYAFMHSGIPVMNNANSILMNTERVLMMAGLRELERKHGKKKFPVIPQTYYSSFEEMVLSPKMPCVIKTFAHAGLGKIKVNTADEFKDVSSMLALTNHNAMAEPYKDISKSWRIQRIGTGSSVQYRVFERIMIGSGWKSQFGQSMQKLVPPEKVSLIHKFWADEIAKLWGGLDWFALDAIEDTEGNPYILEVNTSFFGCNPDYWVEDTCYIADMIIDRLRKEYLS